MILRIRRSWSSSPSRIHQVRTRLLSQAGRWKYMNIKYNLLLSFVIHIVIILLILLIIYH